MNDEVKRDRNEFILVFLPSHRDLRLLEHDTAYRDNWDKMVSTICGPDITCIDLFKDLRQLPESQLAKGYDGTHFGPKANQLIGALIRKHFEFEGVLTERN